MPFNFWRSNQTPEPRELREPPNAKLDAMDEVCRTLIKATTQYPAEFSLVRDDWQIDAAARTDLIGVNGIEYPRYQSVYRVTRHSRAAFWIIEDLPPMGVKARMRVLFNVNVVPDDGPLMPLEDETSLKELFQACKSICETQHALKERKKAQIKSMVETWCANFFTSE